MFDFVISVFSQHLDPTFGYKLLFFAIAEENAFPKSDQWCKNRKYRSKVVIFF
jgi:hypothetical protein